MKKKVILKWSKRENEWICKYPEMTNRNGSVTAKIFLNFIHNFENKMNCDFRTHLEKWWLNPDTFTIRVDFND